MTRPVACARGEVLSGLKLCSCTSGRPLAMIQIGGKVKQLLRVPGGLVGGHPSAVRAVRGDCGGDPCGTLIIAQACPASALTQPSALCGRAASLARKGTTPPSRR